MVWILQLTVIVVHSLPLWAGFPGWPGVSLVIIWIPVCLGMIWRRTKTEYRSKPHSGFWIHLLDCSNLNKWVSLDIIMTCPFMNQKVVTDATLIFDPNLFFHGWMTLYLKLTRAASFSAILTLTSARRFCISPFTPLYSIICFLKSSVSFCIYIIIIIMEIYIVMSHVWMHAHNVFIMSE